MTKYYIAYGSNMDEKQMAFRCPKASFVGTTEVQGYELLFKGTRTGAYATIEEKKGGVVPALVWKITESDEESLDHYEGYPTFYHKKDLCVTVNGAKIIAMVYIMDDKRKKGIPSPRYYLVLKNAYIKYNFDRNILKKALNKSTRGKRYRYGIWS